jgi:hypothetical protein
MAGRGPAGKDRHTRKRNDPEVRELVADGRLRGPALPKGVLPDGEEWHPQTVALWDSLRRFPLLTNEPGPGWQFLLDTALMHHAMWMKGRWDFAAEVRLRLAKYGVTPEDRQRLKVKIVVPAADADPHRGSVDSDPKVTDIRSRRDRLTDAS